MSKIETSSCSQDHLVRQRDLMMHIDSLSRSDSGTKPRLRLVLIFSATDGQAGFNAFSLDANI